MLNPSGDQDCPSNAPRRRLARALAATLAILGMLAGSVLATQSASASPSPAAAPVSAASAGAASVVTAANAVVPVAPTATAQPRLTEVAAIAIKATAMHIPYVFGGGHGRTPGNPSSGLDCSGFARWVYAQVGWNLGAGSAESVRRSGAFARTSHPVPGDLIFFGSSSAYHVGIYISPGKFVDANHPGGFVGLRNIYPGVLGYYHRKDATAFDSQPLRTTVTGSVTVLSPTRTRLAKAQVTVWAGPSCAQRVSTQTTDAMGRVRVRLLSGRYCLSVTSAPAGYLKVARTVVNLQRGKAVHEVLTDPFAPVVKIIRTKLGTAGVSGVKVSVYRSDCRTRVVTKTSASTGNLAVTITPGRYCLQVQAIPSGLNTSRAMRGLVVPVGVSPSVNIQLTRIQR